MNENYVPSDSNTDESSVASHSSTPCNSIEQKKPVMKTAEQMLIIESISYWQHEYYEAATDKLLGDFKEVVIRAMEQYAQEAVNYTDFK